MSAVKGCGLLGFINVHRVGALPPALAELELMWGLSYLSRENGASHVLRHEMLQLSEGEACDGGTIGNCNLSNGNMIRNCSLQSRPCDVD